LPQANQHYGRANVGDRTDRVAWPLYACGVAQEEFAMASPTEYNHFARDCMDIAEDQLGGDARQRLLEIAAEWLKLAEQATAHQQGRFSLSANPVASRHSRLRVWQRLAGPLPRRVPWVYFLDFHVN
jgi:hypothetical protein